MTTPPRPGPARRRLRGRNALLIGLALFAAVQAVLFHMDRWDLRDPEYGHKMLLLQAQLAEHPGRPLVLLIGSSRAEMGFRPDAMPEWEAPPIVFNYALTGSGPVQELLCLRRVLAAGIRPDHILIETLPPVWSDLTEEDRIAPQRLTLDDFVFLSQYSVNPVGLAVRWVGAAFVPCHSLRFNMISHWVPNWVPRSYRRTQTWQFLDAYGRLILPFDTLPAWFLDQERKRAHFEYDSRLNDFKVSPVSDRAQRDLLDLCRREGIPVTLFRMPEDAEFRAMYSAAADRCVQQYMDDLCREFNVEWVDCRFWNEDKEFIDGHHLLPPGAKRFSERFGREVVTRAMGLRLKGPTVARAEPAR